MIHCKNICFSYDALAVLDGVSFDLEKNKVTVLLGPSGCGKTTLLKLCSRLLKADSGTLQFNQNLDSAFIFQEDRLIPSLTVYENMAFVLEKQVRKVALDSIILEYIDLVGLSQFSNFYPEQLSGGMRQRVNIARAFAYPSNIIFMDEPFKGLDLKVKISILDSLKDCLNKTKKTLFCVTHDVREAIYIGDKILVMSDRPGKICETRDNSIPTENRNLENPNFYTLEAELIKILLH